MTSEGSVRHIERDIRGEGKASCGSKPRRGTLLGAGPVHREAQVHEAGGEGRGGAFQAALAPTDPQEERSKQTPGGPCVWRVPKPKSHVRGLVPTQREGQTRAHRAGV